MNQVFLVRVDEVNTYGKPAKGSRTILSFVAYSDEAAHEFGGLIAVDLTDRDESEHRYSVEPLSYLRNGPAGESDKLSLIAMARRAEIVPPVVTVSAFMARLRLAGFEEGECRGGTAMVRRVSDSIFARFCNRDGTGMPAADDWALEVWNMAHDDSEADTDMQCDDDGATIQTAVKVALEELDALERGAAHA